VPGFGAGAFGQDRYGEYRWSRRVFYEYIPEIYRREDALQGGLLEVFAESLRPSFDELRHRIRNLDSLRDPFLVRTQYDEVYRITLGPRLQKIGDLEQKGIDARVDAIQQLYAPGGRFGLLDVGKELTVTGSTLDANNRTVVVASVVDSYTILTYPPLATDAGPLTWELRPTVEVPDNEITVEVRGGSVAAIAPGFILNDGYADFTVLARRQFKETTAERPLLTEKEGSDGSIDSSNNFVSATADFTQRDKGKKISFSGSDFPDNNNRFEITEVVSSTTATVLNADGDPPEEDAGPLFWALLPHEELDLVGTIEPRGTIEQAGSDLAITVAGPPAEVSAPAAEFTDDDVGKYLSIRGSSTPTNNTTLPIKTVTSSNVVELDGTLTVDAGPLTWEVRQHTSIGDDLIEVDVRAPSLIKRLAYDFGIEIDTLESEDRQRSWVKNVSRWIMQKGTARAYEILARISGFESEVDALYRVSAAIASMLPTDVVFEVGMEGLGRTGTTGTDGSLPTTFSFARFYSPTALFDVGDVGSLIRIRDAGVPANDKLYTIGNIVDENTVEFVVGDTVTYPEPNNGSLTWALVRLYTTETPTLPAFDDFDADQMEAIIDGYPPQTTDYFGLDKYCWEDDFYADIEIVVDSVSQISSGVFRVYTTDGPAQGPSSIVGSAEVIKDVGHWVLIEGTAGTGFGREFFVETIPVWDGAYWYFDINAALGPVTGDATIRYVCPTTFTCDYCGASKIMIRLTADTIASESGVAVERAFERVLERMEEVTPAHVLLIPVLTNIIECTLSLTATVDPSLALASIIVPKDAYFDELPADVLVADPTGHSSDYHYSGPEETDTPFLDFVIRCTVETP
jgi:hypothetical protein